MGAGAFNYWRTWNLLGELRCFAVSIFRAAVETCSARGRSENWRNGQRLNSMSTNSELKARLERLGPIRDVSRAPLSSDDAVPVVLHRTGALDRGVSVARRLVAAGLTLSVSGAVFGAFNGRISTMDGPGVAGRTKEAWTSFSPRWTGAPA